MTNNFLKKMQPRLWSKLTSYDKAMLVSFFLQLSLFTMTLWGDSGSVLFLGSDNWFMSFLSIPLFFSAPVSGSGYVGRTVDAWPNPETRKNERYGTIIGLGIGLALGVALNFLMNQIPFFKALKWVACLLLTINTVNTFSSLGNRIGQFFDKNNRDTRKNNTRYSRETKVMFGVALLGIAAGIALFLTNCAPLFSITGVLTFSVTGPVLPAVIAGIIFVGRFASTLASASDYITKTHTYFRRKKNQRVHNEKFIAFQDRTMEYKRSMHGVIAGLSVAALIIIGLILTQPYLMVGAGAFFLPFMIASTCLSVFGKMMSAYGRYEDAGRNLKEINKVEAPPSKGETAMPSTSSPSSRKRSPSPHGLTSSASVDKLPQTSSTVSKVQKELKRQRENNDTPSSSFGNKQAVSLPQPSPSSNGKVDTTRKPCAPPESPLVVARGIA